MLGEHAVGPRGDGADDAEFENSLHGRRWRIRQSGENQRPFYLPDQLFHELFAPAEQLAYQTAR